MAGKDERAARLKAQLRANLKRRKAPAPVTPDLVTPAPVTPAPVTPNVEPDQRRTAIDPMSTAADAAD